MRSSKDAELGEGTAGAGSLAADGDFKPRSPGMKYKHYAPKAEMIILEGQHGESEDAIADDSRRSE